MNEFLLFLEMCKYICVWFSIELHLGRMCKLLYYPCSCTIVEL